MSRKTTAYLGRLDQLGDFKPFPNFSPHIMRFLCGSKSNPVHIYVTLKALLDFQAALTEEQACGQAGTLIPVNESPDILGGFNTHRTACLSPRKLSMPKPTGETFSHSRMSKPNGLMQMASDLLTNYEYKYVRR